MDLLSISVAPTTKVIGKRYYDLPGNIEVMRRLMQARVVDGCEFQHVEEWDAEEPPRDEREKRLAAWNDSRRYTPDEVAAALREAGAPILSIHAKRDIGIYLCSDDQAEIDRGRRLLHEALWLTENVGAPVCVFHLWDTWKEAFDPAFLRDTLRDIASSYPTVKAAVENVPTHLIDCAPFDLARAFAWITLDLRWAALYDELDRFEAAADRIANVHLRGRLEDGVWTLDRAPFGLYEAVETIKGWGYAGLWTLEPEGRLSEGDWENLAAAMSALGSVVKAGS